MNILFVSALDLFGKDDAPLRAPGKTIKYYIDKGYNIEVIGISRRNEGYQKFGVDVTTYAFFDVRNVVLRYLFLNFLFPIFLNFSLFLRRKKAYDFLYAYEVHGVVGSFIYAYAKKIKLISRFQGTVLTKNMSKVLRYFVYFNHYIAFSLRCFRAIITDDGTDAARLFRKFNSSPFIFLKNGINHNENIFDFDKSYFNLLMCSRLVNWKRVDRIFDALERLDLSQVHYRLRLYVIGDGPDAYKLQKRSLGLKSIDVIFTGHISQSDSYSMISGCDIFISLYDLSNVGNPLLEALYSNRPIITIATGKTASVISNDYNGVILDKFDIEKFNLSLIQLINDESKRTSLSAGAKEYSDKYLYSWKRRLDSELEFILK